MVERLKAGDGIWTDSERAAAPWRFWQASSLWKLRF